MSTATCSLLVVMEEERVSQRPRVQNPGNLDRNSWGNALARAYVALRCHFYKFTFFFLTEPPFNGSINKNQTLVRASLPPHSPHHGPVAHSPLAASRHPDSSLWEPQALGGGKAQVTHFQNPWLARSSMAQSLGDCWGLRVACAPMSCPVCAWSSRRQIASSPHHRRNAVLS